MNITLNILSLFFSQSTKPEGAQAEQIHNKADQPADPRDANQNRNQENPNESCQEQVWLAF